MIWYRHSLEMRSRLPVLALMLIVFGLWPGNMIGATSFDETGRTFQAMLGTPLAQSLSKEQLLIWASFADRILLLIWMTAFGLTGNAFRNAWMPHDASVYYTLTLPVSRGRLIWTRHVAGWMIGIVAVAMMLVVQCAILTFQGSGVPFVPLATSLLFSLPFLAAWISILGALNFFMHEFWALLASMPLAGLSIRLTWYTVTAFPSRGEMPWDSLAAVLAATALALTCSMLWGKTKEF